jgi:CheY-like chemotaxis protein
MKLTYSVLWFDDDEDFLESLDTEAIEENFAEWGFNCSLKLVSNTKDFLDEAPYKEYDLILMDYSLDALGEHGQTFIKQVREQHVLTEVIFYSSHSNELLWNAVRDEKLEGIYVASRQNQGQLDKLYKVAKHTIHKVLDLENVRGIVMAEVGSNDELLSSIAKKAYLELNENEKNALIKKYCDNITEQCKKNIDKSADINQEQDFDKLICLLDSTKKWNICKSLSRKIDWLDIGGGGDYQSDVLIKRNYLAHGIPEKLDGGALKFSFSGREFIFDNDESLKLRRNLKAYGEYFDSLLG